MRRFGVLCTVVLVILQSAAANAAMLSDVQGQVLVNRGNGYVAATGGMQLNPGDKVVVNPGGSAQISYGGGCVVPVPIGAIASVTASPPCLTTGALPDPDPAPGGFAMTPLATAGVVAGGIGIAALVLSLNKSSKPASP